VAQGERVLVTGAGGFVAKHCVAELLRRGYRVRGSVRRPEAAAEVSATVGVADPERLDFATLDLTSDAGWDAAMRGCRYLMHVASPFPMRVPRSRDELLVPAREGTRRALLAAARAGIERAVLTSSTAAILAGHPRGSARVWTEADWSDVDSPTIQPYPLSKTLAERLAWELVAGEAAGMELAVVNPGFVLGPALDRDLGTSAEIVRLFLRGAYPAVPRLSFPVVDVRDVAIAHVAALEVPEAAGQRFICAAESLWLKDIGRILRTALPEFGRRPPVRELPDFAVRLLAPFDANLRAAKSEIGELRRVSSARAQSVLGVRFRPAEEAVTAMARSLVELGVVTRPAT
jgi:dihydroflavonol-4-reductase